ncbi:Metal tolerance protein C2 [Nymphaea thermarum]|nr:Metal tolerance protein C2 [Nymphaea thermarum]
MTRKPTESGGEMSRVSSFNSRSAGGREFELLPGAGGDTAADRRIAFSRHPSFRKSDDPVRQPLLSRSFATSLETPKGDVGLEFPMESGSGKEYRVSPSGGSVLALVVDFLTMIRCGNRPMKRLSLMILLNVVYSSTELLVGLFTSRVGFVSDAFHLTFGCSLLTFSLFSMAMARSKATSSYSYGYKRLEVLSAFTNALFLLFMSFSLAVEALHAFIQDESEHKHYLILSAVTNLLVNLLGVWFFRSYARVNIVPSSVYRRAEDMNCHSVCLHVIADSIRSAGLILASWFLALGVENAEVLCLGLVSVAVFMLTMPLFKATGAILLQTAPCSIPPSAFSKCWRQIVALGDVSEVSQARFWELVPGHVVGSLSIQVKREVVDTRPILQFVHSLYHDIGIHDLTVQTEFV